MNEQIRNKILMQFRAKDMLKNIGEDDDFFNFGVSSLTIVELQIIIEKQLGLKALTKDLMRASTVNQWSEIYARKAQEVS